MNLSDMEMLLQQEMEAVHGGAAGVCQCKTGAQVGGEGGSCECEKGANMSAPEIKCNCSTGAAFSGGEIVNPPIITCTVGINR